jgi:hypothetical protein
VTVNEENMFEDERNLEMRMTKNGNGDWKEWE